MHTTALQTSDKWYVKRPYHFLGPSSLMSLKLKLVLIFHERGAPEKMPTYLFQQGKSCSGQLVENMPLDMDLKLKLPFRNPYTICMVWEFISKNSKSLFMYLKFLKARKLSKIFFLSSIPQKSNENNFQFLPDLTSCTCRQSNMQNSFVSIALQICFLT